MDANLQIKAHPTVIGSISDFTYKWCINADFSEDDAARLTLAVTELVTDIVLFAFPDDESGEFRISFHRGLSNAVITIHELGEPFDPDRHIYNREKAVNESIFDGAGLELVRHLVDDFQFINLGRAGKQFRIEKYITAQPTVDLFPDEPVQVKSDGGIEGLYTVKPLTLEDAEDVSKLIYRTYGYSYPHDDLYYPHRIEQSLARKDKFGVIVRDNEGEPVGYFAVIRSTDSSIGEVGEAVVAPRHRRRGIMTRMLDALISLAKENNILGLFGLAVTVHDISQRVNIKMGFTSTALLLAESPVILYKEINEHYPQPISEIVDFLMLKDVTKRLVYVPPVYQKLFLRIYKELDLAVAFCHVPSLEMTPAKSDIQLTLSYEDRHAIIVVWQLGQDFPEIISEAVLNLQKNELNVLYVDLPLNDSATPGMVSRLHRAGFVLSGLLPLFHHESDYIRMQRFVCPLDFSQLIVQSEIGQCIVKAIRNELKWNFKESTINSQSGLSATSIC
jgi:anti-sigma regulatory factor (Ser/Thr protein kinase)/RimJ/RimL family protein N-acetyltransferase